jgi:dihydrodipicolinate synthase/N-acetylneuraminate lyase
MQSLIGWSVALVTPFKTIFSIDVDAFKRNSQFH